MRLNFYYWATSGVRQTNKQQKNNHTKNSTKSLEEGENPAFSQVPI